MIETNISNKNVATLKFLQKHHPHHAVRRRALTLLLKHQKISHHKIAASVGVCENTVRSYLRGFSQKGIAFVTAVNFYKPQGKLKSFDAVIKAHFECNPPKSIAQACHEVKGLTNILIKNTQMRAYLKSLGMDFRKVSGIPAKADVNAQKQFHDNELQPRLDKAKAGKCDVYFMDAAHFVFGAFLGYLWCFVRVFVRTPSGRQRLNVLGALNAVTKKLVTITNDTYITSIQVCELLKMLSKNATKPVIIVLDNARYQRCSLVIQTAQTLGVELLFLPPYSPNLNLIERLWKLVKKECLYSTYYENFLNFSGAIKLFLTNTNKKHQNKLNSLLTLNFQLFTKKQLKSAL